MDPVWDWLGTGVCAVIAVLIATWMAGAIYYDLCGATVWGRALGLLWVAGTVAACILWQQVWQPLLALLVVFAGFLAWWLRLKPSHDRDWDPTVAVLPRATQDGDVVTIENVRNFEYRALEDYTPRYETRVVRLSLLRGADVILFNWGLRWMSHPVLSFDFGADGFVCFSIEVRYRRGQPFAMIRSLYRQQEIIVLAADERDIILRRTKFGKPQTARIYRLMVDLERVRNSFLDYINAMNRLYETPRWYHAIFANCTTTFYRLPHSRPLRDCRVLANGHFDRALYDNGQLDHSVPFEVLRERALITDIANAAPEAGFSEFLRRELERRAHD